MTTIVAFDLSLTAPAVCVLTDEGYTAQVIHIDKMRGHERIEHILDWVDRMTPPDAKVLIEGFSFGSKGRSTLDIAGLGWIIRHHLWKRGIAYTEVPPSTLKKWATGKGNADKGLMLVTAVKRYGYDGSDHNEADAILLAHYGAQT